MIPDPIAPDPTDLDVGFCRSNFPAFELPTMADRSFFENAGGSFPCRQTIEALTRFYTENKVQPYAPYELAQQAGHAMDRSRHRWAEALRVTPDDVQFGPSTSANTYALAHAYRGVLGDGDRVIVTNQDHEANTGAIRRAAEAAGAEVVEWRVDPATGLLDIESLVALLMPTTRLVTVPHCSNVVGQENDVTAIASLAHEVGARVIVDGVSFAPHTIPNVAALDADVYLFSLYKTYSVHQGLMVTRRGVLDELPNQGHYFNESLPAKRLTPAGPDHAQEAAAGAVLDYVEAVHRHHGGAADAGLAAAVDDVSARWRAHETALLPEVLDVLAASPAARLLGPGETGVDGRHRCPTVAFVPLERQPDDVVHDLVERGVLCGAGTFYADRLLDGLDVDPARGVVRVSWVHYTDTDDITRLVTALRGVLG